MASVTREPIGLLNDKITVKISKDDYYPSFEKSIKDYSKKANIPGFRKGMVPAGMVKKMYGASIFYDEIVKVVDKEIQQYLTKENPDIFAQPLPISTDLRNIDMNSPSDYDFPFEIGLKPEIKIPDFSTLSPVFHKVDITEEMIDAEIERLQTRHGKLSDQETVSVDDNVLNVQFNETDAAGNVIENGISKDNSLLVKYFTSPLKEQLMDKKVNDSIQLQLENAFEEKEREWIIGDLGLNKEDPQAIKKDFQMVIHKIGLIGKPDMDETFFNDVFPGKEIKTEDEFKAALTAELQQHWDAQGKVQLQDQLYHILIDTPMEFPEEFLKKWMQRSAEKPKSEKEVEDEFPTFKSQLKWMLISDKLIHDNKIEVSQEELRSYMQNEIMQYFGQMKLDGDTSWLDSYVDRMMKDEKQVESSYRRLTNNKLFEWMESQVTPVEKAVTSEELNAMQHNHQH